MTTITLFSGACGLILRRRRGMQVENKVHRKVADKMWDRFDEFVKYATVFEWKIGGVMEHVRRPVARIDDPLYLAVRNSIREALDAND
jgi:hypothetical protein